MEKPEETIARLQDELAPEQASLLRHIGDNIPDGALYQVVAETDGSRRFVYLSAGFEQLIGVPADEAIADPGQLYRLIHPDDLEHFAAAEAKAVASKSRFDEIVRMRHARSGELRWVHLRSAPRELSDGRTLWDGIYVDVTNQKRIEQALTHSLQRLDLAQQAGNIGVFDWEVQTGRLIWTEEEQRIFGLVPGTFEGTIDGWADRLVPEDAERMKEEMRAAMGARVPQMTFAFRIVTPDGAQRWIEGAGRFSYDEEGKPIRMVGVNVDVTDRKEAENALRAADRRKSEFLAMLSHELRNPLAAISNALELCSTGEPDAATFEWSRIVMRRQVTHLTRLVDDLLDVTRITSGKIQLRMQRVDCADILDSAISGLRLLFAERGQEIVRSYTRGALSVDGDPTRLEQVIVNLLTNAAKYTHRGGKIWAHAERENGEVVISIRDNGVGIDPTVISEMFDLFAQGRRSIARSEGGLGLGLTISRTLVEMHGGKISARSAGEGHGSEFIVRLPAARGESPETPARSDGSANPVHEKLRVLVVDDHVDTALSLARLLRARGHVVEIVHDGNAALAAADTFRPNFVLLDLGLPGMDGYEVAQNLRTRDGSPRATIIAISGYGQEEDRQRSSEVGIDHHLVKPVSFAQLEQMLTAGATA
jgi:PAS domain S-box-containing protein